MLPINRDKFTETMYTKITDYVLKNYGELIKEAGPLLDRPMIYTDQLNAMEAGIMAILIKEGFFKKKWNTFYLGHVVRTNKPIPKASYVRKE